MPEKKDSHQAPSQGGAQYGALEAPSQESIALLTSLLLEFKRGTTSTTGSGLPPPVERDIEAVNATFDSLQGALSLAESPLAISSVTPSRGSSNGGTRVTIAGSHLLPGATVQFGNNPAKDVSVVSLTEIQATTPPGSTGAVDVVVNTLGGSATLKGGYTYEGTYQSS